MEATPQEDFWQNILNGIEEYTQTVGVEHAIQKMVKLYGEEEVRKALEYGNEPDLLKLI